MENFDDIARRYREEIENLYKSQNEEYIVTENEAENQNENNNEVYMPPAVRPDSEVYSKSKEKNMGTGFLRVEVSAGGNAFPIEDALVVITEYVDGAEKVIRILVTNQDGRTDIIELPAPEEAVLTSNGSPYSNYNAIIFHEGYYEVHNRNIPIFAGITSLQPVSLVPMPIYKEGREIMTFYDQEPQF